MSLSENTVFGEVTFCDMSLMTSSCFVLVASWLSDDVLVLRLGFGFISGFGLTLVLFTGDDTDPISGFDFVPVNKLCFGFGFSNGFITGCDSLRMFN